MHNKNGVKLYEAYCESWACTLNALFVSFLSNPNQNKSTIMNNALINLKKEVYFSLFQCVQISRHYDTQAENIFNGSSKKIIIEETNVFSYYFLKTVLLYHLDSFLGWCAKHNKPNLFQFHITKTNIRNFTSYVIKMSREKTFLESVGKMQEKIEGYYYPFLQMTLYG